MKCIKKGIPGRSSLIRLINMQSASPRFWLEPNYPKAFILKIARMNTLNIIEDGQILGTSISSIDLSIFQTDLRKATSKNEKYYLTQHPYCPINDHLFRVPGYSSLETEENFRKFSENLVPNAQLDTHQWWSIAVNWDTWLINQGVVHEATESHDQFEGSSVHDSASCQSFIKRIQDRKVIAAERYRYPVTLPPEHCTVGQTPKMTFGISPIYKTQLRWAALFIVKPCLANFPGYTTQKKYSTSYALISIGPVSCVMICALLQLSRSSKYTNYY